MRGVILIHSVGASLAERRDGDAGVRGRRAGGGAGRTLASLPRHAPPPSTAYVVRRTEACWGEWVAHAFATREGSDSVARCVWRGWLF